MKIQEMTPQQVFLEWCNNFGTISRMAEYYNLHPQNLGNLIREGRKENDKQAYIKAYHEGNHALKNNIERNCKT